MNIDRRQLILPALAFGLLSVAGVSLVPALAASADEEAVAKNVEAFRAAQVAAYAKALDALEKIAKRPSLRNFDGECGLVSTRRRSSSGRVLAQSHCAKPTKNRCSGVRPSTSPKFLFRVAAFHAM